MCQALAALLFPIPDIMAQDDNCFPGEKKKILGKIGKESN